MAQMSIGDLSMSFWNQINNRRLKAEMQDLAFELSTGKTSDLHAVTGGDFKILASLESSFASLKAYRTTNAESALFVENIQSALATIQDSSTEIGAALMSAASSDSESIIQVTTTDARGR